MDNIIMETISSILTRLKIQFPSGKIEYRILTINDGIVKLFYEPEGIEPDQNDIIAVVFGANEDLVSYYILEKGVPVHALFDEYGVLVRFSTCFEENCYFDIVKEGQQLKHYRCYNDSYSLSEAWKNATEYAGSLANLQKRLLEFGKILSVEFDEPVYDLSIEKWENGEVMISYKTEEILVRTERYYAFFSINQDNSITLIDGK